MSKGERRWVLVARRNRDGYSTLVTVPADASTIEEAVRQARQELGEGWSIADDGRGRLFSYAECPRSIAEAQADLRRAGRALLAALAEPFASRLVAHRRCRRGVEK